MWGLDEIVAMNREEVARRQRNAVKAGCIAQTLEEPPEPCKATYQEERADPDQFDREGVDD